MLFACGQTPKNKNVMEEVYNKSDQEWKKILSPEQYYVLRQKGTEEPFSGKFLMTKEKGVYKCSACGNPLFSSEAKFDSHCGWPSFDKEIKAGIIKTAVDSSHGMVRTEIMCGKCGGHLGHVFHDGPTETGLRYCVNSVSLEFVAEKEALHKNNDATDTITFGGGCFWCMEALFERVKGVESVTSGYAGGTTENPTYEEVSSGKTNHAEVVQIIFNPKQIRLEDILEIFFAMHDPTTLNRQGADVGTQYRSVIFYLDARQKKIITKCIKTLDEGKSFGSPIVTQVVPFTTFYEAENYHQDYYNKNGVEPYCRIVILPKLRKLHDLFNNHIDSGK